MSTPIVDELIARLEKGRQKTFEFFSALTPEEWEKTVYSEPTWKVRHLLAHFVSAEEHLLALAQDVARGGAGAAPDLDIHRFNAEEQSRLEGQSPESLLAALDRARRAAIEWVRTLEESQLKRVGRHPALGEVTLETIINSIYGHQLMHMRDLMELKNANWNNSRKIY